MVHREEVHIVEAASQGKGTARKIDFQWIDHILSGSNRRLTSRLPPQALEDWVNQLLAQQWRDALRIQEIDTGYNLDDYPPGMADKAVLLQVTQPCG
jgi:hypothetical protein